MTQLVDLMQVMGLKGEASRTGRWIRFSGEQGPAYVVEAAWGGGYYAFCEAPARVTMELYLDPISAIESCLRAAESKGPAEWHEPRYDAALATQASRS